MTGVLGLMKCRGQLRKVVRGEGSDSKIVRWYEWMEVQQQQQSVQCKVSGLRFWRGGPR